MDAGAFAIFIFSAMLISLSGVISPGPMTAATIEHGARSRLSGFYISIGHGIVEAPLIIAIYLGASRLLQHQATAIAIGLLGGLYLLYMAAGLLRPRPAQSTGKSKVHAGHSMIAGIVLSITNPYFLLWWATIGLGLVLGAEKFGLAGIAVFIVAHWLCDLVWFTLLGLLAYKGVEAFGAGLYRKVSVICGASLLIFGGMFIYSSIRLMIS